MKKFTLILTLTLAVLPFTVSAARIEGGDQFTLPVDEVSLGNMYLGSGNANILGQVVGDLYVGAGNTVISGQITDDVVIVGGNTTITGSIGGDVRVIGGQTTITGTVGGDIFVMGGSLTAGGETLGDVDFIGGHFVLAPSAMVGGDVTYRSDRRAEVSPEAYIVGELTYDKTLAQRLGVLQAGNTSFATGLAALLGAWLFLKLLMLVFASLVIYWLLLGPLEKVVKTAFTHSGKLVVTGFAAIVAVPVLVLILAITIIGLPLAVILGLFYGGTLLASKLLAGAVFGVWLDRKIFKRENWQPTWKNVLLGTLAFFILSYVPIVGWIFSFGLMALVCGAMLEILYKRWLARSK